MPGADVPEVCWISGSDLRLLTPRERVRFICGLEPVSLRVTRPAWNGIAQGLGGPGQEVRMAATPGEDQKDLGTSSA